MSWDQEPLTFAPGLYANRSKRASRGRWVDGNLVRFDDDVPAQMGGWLQAPVFGLIAGRAREMIAWKPNSGIGRLGMIGTHSNIYKFDGGAVSDITPAGFVAGRADSMIGAGYGAGAYGREDYGDARSLAATVLDAGLWTMDLYGDVGIGCFNGNTTIYEYTEGAAQMVPVTNAPRARAMCVSDERHVFAFDADGVPGKVRWSDRENRTIWTAAIGNRAGGHTVQVTSPFQCGKRLRGAVMAWTQNELWAFAPLNSSLVYSKDRIGGQCGVMGPLSVAIVSEAGGEVGYWMAPHGFYAYDGLVRQLDCELQDYVFKDINVLQRAKAHARTNKLKREIWFFYCSAQANEIDRAVVYNYQNRTWTKALIGRTAWLDIGVYPLPFAIDENGVLYEHEKGSTANGAVMPSYVLSHPLGGGSRFLDILDFWPDMEALSGTAAISFVLRDFPGDLDEVVGPFPFTPADEKVDLTISARQVQVKIAGVSGHWELGEPALTVQQGSGR